MSGDFGISLLRGRGELLRGRGGEDSKSLYIIAIDKEKWKEAIDKQLLLSEQANS